MSAVRSRQDAPNNYKGMIVAVSKREDVMNRAYGNVPKDVPNLFDFGDFIPSPRGVKYWFIRLIRWFTRSRSK